MDVNAAIQNLFYGELKGVVNARTLRDEAVKRGLNISLADAERFVKNQATNQRFRRLNPKPYFVPIVGKPNQYSADLMFFDRGTKKFPILVILHLTTRKAYVRLLRNKEAATTATAMEDILDEIERDRATMTSLEHDAGTEFRGRFLTLMNIRSIEDIRFPRGNASKTSLGKLNRFIRTLRAMMEMAETNLGGDWRNYLQDIVNIYNDTISSYTKFTPNQMTEDPKRQNYIRAKEFGRNLPAYDNVDKYVVGTKVRKLIDYDIFQKGSKPKFSEEIYTIAERRTIGNDRGYSFTLMDNDGEPVMATNIKGEEHLKPEVRLWRAWELLPVDADKVQSTPSEFKQNTERLTETEQKVANYLNRERRRVGAPTIEQDVPNPEVYAQTLEKEQRPKREVQKTEKVQEQPVRKPRKVREPREPKPRKTIEAQITQVRGHREHKGKLSFQVKWSHLNEEQNKKYEWVPYSDVAFPQPDGSELVNEKVLAYMRRKKLTLPD